MATLNDPADRNTARTDYGRTEVASATFAHKRISWGAVFAGVAIAIVVHILLGVLGIAIGVSTIDPLEENNPVAGLGIGSAIYLIISAIIALFAGGYVAGALAVIQDHRDRTLHGLTTWAVVTILMFMLLTTAIGRVIGGTANMVASGVSMAGDAVASVAGPIADQVQTQLEEAGIDLDIASIRQEARELTQQAKAPGGQSSQAEQIGDEVANQAERVARDPQAANDAIQEVLTRIQGAMSERMSAADRESLVNVLVSRTDMNEQEALETVKNWEEAYEKAYQTAQEELKKLQAEAEQKAREWGETAAKAVAAAAWWTLIILILSAIAAAVGANVGANRPAVAVREQSRY